MMILFIELFGQIEFFSFLDLHQDVWYLVNLHMLMKF